MKKCCLFYIPSINMSTGWKCLWRDNIKSKGAAFFFLWRIRPEYSADNWLYKMPVPEKVKPLRGEKWWRTQRCRCTKPAQLYIEIQSEANAYKKTLHPFLGSSATKRSWALLSLDDLRTANVNKYMWKLCFQYCAGSCNYRAVCFLQLKKACMWNTAVKGKCNGD